MRKCSWICRLNTERQFYNDLGPLSKWAVDFDAAAMGKFRKSIKVVANVEGGPEYLYIKGTVLEKSEADSQ